MTWLVGLFCASTTNGILLGMSFDKKDANGSLKNMKGRCEITQREKKATGMLKLKKTESEQKNHLTEHLQQPSEAQNEQPPAQSTSSDTDFSKMTVNELKSELKQRNAKGFSQINKAGLIKQLEEIYKHEHQQSANS